MPPSRDLMKPPILVDNLSCRKTPQGAYRVSALVDGHELWFESEHEIVAAPEAFLSCMLLAGMKRKRDLQCAQAVDEVWLCNNAELQRIFHDWWGEAIIGIRATGLQVAPPPDPKSALLFTAGVDSFHSLLRGGHKPDYLLNIEGLDIAVESTDLRSAIRKHLQKIADESGIPLLTMSTNLRRHPLFKPLSYLRTHGSAMAACAHLLRSHFGELFISSSSVRSYDVPFGTHWDTDPLWSSTQTRIRHTGCDLWRSDKLGEIMDEPIVCENLRVCYQHASNGRLNCSECEKCVRTMLALHQRKRLEQFPTLQPAVSLAKSVRRVSAVKDVSLPVYQKFHSLERDPGIRAALQQLIRRNSGPLRRLKRSLHKKWCQLTAG